MITDGTLTPFVTREGHAGSPDATKRRAGRSLALALVALATACGGGARDEEGGTESEITAGGEGEGATAATADVAWADMSMEQRGHYMEHTVVPEMRSIFQEYDGEEYAEFGCATCHGENARDVHFRMPNDLAPLNPANIGGIFQSEEPVAQLMTQRVWPRMAELLQQPPFDPETGEGFSCMGCHATEGDEGS